MKNFTPVTPTVTIAATSTTARVALSGVSDDDEDNVLISNNGPNIAFVRLGASAVNAAVTDLPILPYTALIVARSDATHAAAICNATQTAAVYFTSGNGN